MQKPPILRAIVLALGLGTWITGLAATVPGGDGTLVPGNPALTQSMLDKYGGFIQWLLELQFSDQERRQFDGYIVQDWKNHDAESVQSTLEAIHSAEDIEKIKPVERDLYRQEMLKTVLPSMRENARSEPEVRWLLDLYEREHKALAHGDPPLTRRMAVARTEYAVFVLLNSGVLPGEPDQAFKDRMVQQLVADYPGLSAEQQKEVSTMPWTWATLRATWENLPEAEKRKYRQEWAQAAQESMSDWQRHAVKAMEQSKRLMDSLEGRVADAGQLARAADQLDRLAQELRQDAENRELADSMAGIALSLRGAGQPPAPAQAGSAAAGGDGGGLRDEMTDEQWARYQQMSPQQRQDENFRLVMQRAQRQHSMSLWTGAHVMNNIYAMHGSSTRMIFNGFTP